MGGGKYGSDIRPLLACSGRKKLTCCAPQDAADCGEEPGKEQSSLVCFVLIVSQPGVTIMQVYKFAVVLIASITGASLPAMAQGAGGGAGSGSASAGSTGTTGASISGPANSSGSQTGTQNNPNNPTPQSKTTNTVAGEQKAVVSGANTVAQPGAISAPGVGVGHAANGLPIGSPGSGLGSPEQPIDGRVK
jgi:hypothetical protein